MKEAFRQRLVGVGQASTADDIRVSGRVTEPLRSTCSSLFETIADHRQVWVVFVRAAPRDFALGTTFRYGFQAGPAGTSAGETLELLAVTQQFNKPFAAIPRGWKTICAFRALAGPASVLARLPVSEDWYQYPWADDLVVSAF